MLTHLRIKDFALIDELDLELTGGLNVLTGETGAGKSILVDAIGLVLGDRADAAVVRHGHQRAEISVEFDLGHDPDTLAWLEEQELDDEAHCLLRRTINSQGRSRAYVNGHKVPVQQLRRLGERLMDIHGQHEHQSLLKPRTQLSLIDQYGDHAQELAAVRESWRAWKDAGERLAELEEAAGGGAEGAEFLRHQVRELEALELAPGEIEALESEHDRLRHGGRLLEEGQQALSLAYDGEEGSASDLLSQALHRVESLVALDARLEPIRSTLEQAGINLEEAGEDLRRYLSDLDLDPARLNWVADRIGTAHELARKHRVEPQALVDTLESMRERLDAIEHAGERLAEARQTVEDCRSRWQTAADALHAKRKATANTLSEKVTEVMQGLGLSGGQLAIQVTQDAEAPRANGADAVVFEVSMNAGQPLRSLARVASGGELSRIGLAIQVVAARRASIPAMIFDEVDAGIGGGVAEIVGRELRRLGERCQVLCVTHLAQVASQGHHHFRIAKNTRQGETFTRVTPLKDTERVEELARMLGGTEITETSRDHAREMMEKAG
ncbi:DNA repair protein RecN [Natronospira bacteriovora]|uniref:DNA repair protein RecN n=1 Tax=Natronospira bacteriovora TaxID=3069753 RepID=A0ABU0W518_9GAMM|nr:DNA repair protein RecN [Natronospira sp. AB-CW4]MDQ2069112.1 DNA repair protein RecN [Natronospira sp. AB-CW4]